MTLKLSRFQLQGTLAAALFAAAIPLNFIYTYLAARSLVPAIPGLIGALTYGLLLLIFPLFLTDKAGSDRLGVRVAFLTIVYVFFAVLYYKFFVVVISPDIDSELFGDNIEALLKVSVFLIVGAFILRFGRYRQLITASFAAMAIVVILSLDVRSFSIIMPTLLDLSGMYLFLGDTFAVVTVLCLGIARTNPFRAVVFIVGVISLYAIGSRASLYALIPVVGALGMILARSYRDVVSRAVYTITLAAMSVMLIMTPFLFLNLGDTRMFRFLGSGYDASWSFRQWQLEEGLRVIKENPLFGSYGSDYLLLGRWGDYIHSYLELWRQYGLLPFALFVASLTISAFTLWRTRFLSGHPAWRTAVLLMVFSVVEIVFARTWGSPYVFMAIGMTGFVAHLGMRSVKIETTRSIRTPGRSAGRPAATLRGA